MSSFVQSEFAERCQLLLNLCEKADLARNLGHPDIKRYNGALSREWVRFYLAHGNYMNVPPTLAFVASTSWNTGINEIGHAISRLINTGISRDETSKLKFRIQLLKEPQRIEQLQQVFINRRKYIEQSNDVADMKMWLESALLAPAKAIFEQVSSAPELQHKLRTDVDAHLATFERIYEHESAGTEAEVIRVLFGNLQNEISFDMSFWEVLFFYST